MTPIVLLRGLSREADHSKSFLQQLMALEPSREILNPDLPGTGKRFNETAPRTLDETLSCLIPQLSPTSFHLVGISLGGMIASELAERFPDRIKTLTLINTSFRRYSYPWQRLQWQRAPQIIKALVNWNQVRKREASILSLVSNLTESSKILDTWVAIQKKHPVSFKSVVNQMRVATRYVGPDQSPIAHTQVLFSDADRLVSSQCSKNLAKAWGVESHAHTTAGHDLFLDAPKWCAEHISSFIQSCEK